MFAFDPGTQESCFTLRAPAAGPVFLVGDFNGWRGQATPMRRDVRGWSACLRLPPGRYRYGFSTRGVILRDRDALLEDTRHGWPWSVVEVPAAPAGAAQPSANKWQTAEGNLALLPSTLAA